jgi:hypothetical protein
MNRVTRKLVSLLGIVAVLFAQLSVSAYACPMQFMGMYEASSVVVAAEVNSSGRDVESPALCQKHCENGQQNVSDSSPPLVFVSLEPALVVTQATDALVPLPVATLTPSLLHATSPPLSICHCCFRI